MPTLTKANIPLQKQTPYPKNLPIKCFRCLQPGHRSNECSQQRSTNLTSEVEQFEDENDLDTLELENVALIIRDEGERTLSYIVQKVLLAPKLPKHPNDIP